MANDRMLHQKPEARASMRQASGCNFQTALLNQTSFPAGCATHYAAIKFSQLGELLLALLPLFSAPFCVRAFIPNHHEPVSFASWLLVEFTFYVPASVSRCCPG